MKKKQNIIMQTEEEIKREVYACMSVWLRAEPETRDGKVTENQRKYFVQCAHSTVCYITSV